MIRVKWVRPEDRKDIPKDVEGFLEGKKVILVEGRADSSTEEHEKAHIRLGHSPRRKLSPWEYIEDEVDAHLYTYKRTRQPKKIIDDLRGLWDSLIGHWGLTPSKGLRVISGVFRSKENKIPKQWKRDLVLLKRRYKEGREEV